MSQEATSTVLPASAASMFTQTAADALPTSYVETDPAQCSQARLAHLLGIFGIVGTGIFYVVKKNEAGPFVKDQMKEAFNFQLLVFAVAIVLNVVSVIGAAIVGAIAMVLSLAVMALMVGALVLTILNALKAGKGQVARYPARIPVLK